MCGHTMRGMKNAEWWMRNAERKSEARRAKIEVNVQTSKRRNQSRPDARQDGGAEHRRAKFELNAEKSPRPHIQVETRLESDRRGNGCDVLQAKSGTADSHQYATLPLAVTRVYTAVQ